MTALLVLVPAFPYENANLDVLLPALRLKFEVSLGALDSLGLSNGSVEVRDERGEILRLNEFPFAWVFGFGQRHNFLDKMQLLRLAENTTRLINNVDSLLFGHAKYQRQDLPAPLRYPETFATNRMQDVIAKIADGGQWILKPPGLSFGRGVFRLDAHDPHHEALADLMTGFGKGDYCVLQRFVAEIERGEIRALLAGGEFIGAYQRHAQGHGTTNLARGAIATAVQLRGEETEALISLAEWLCTRGIRYAGIDLAFPWVIEINVANPGGLATLANLGDADYGSRCAQAIARWANDPSGE